jgi:hypothetical protein
MNRLTRYLIAIATSAIVALVSLTTGLLVGKYAVEHGIPWGFTASVTLAVVVLVLVPVYVVKKLLVDYW